MTKLLLVDGSALLHRAYHAYPPLKSKTGEIVGAVYGVLSMLLSTLGDITPSYVVVAWDLPKPTFRHVKYVGYKAQRPKADAEMVEQIPLVKEMIASIPVLQIEREGYEADDIIGTMSKHGSDENEVIILTGDQDAMQLVSEHVRVLTPAKGTNPPVMYGTNEVKDKYGVEPDKIVDYKALIGDTSDNIPGVAGIGPKTAVALINQYGGLEAIYECIDKIDNPKIKEKLVAGRDSAILSLDLSKIVTDMELEQKLEDMRYSGILSDNLKIKLEEYGFKSLLKRYFNEVTQSQKIDKQMGLF